MQIAENITMLSWLEIVKYAPFLFRFMPSMYSAFSFFSMFSIMFPTNILRIMLTISAGGKYINIFLKASG